MKTLERLKSNVSAKIENLKNDLTLKLIFVFNRIFHGSFIRYISYFGLIKYIVNSKIYNVNFNIAENVNCYKIKNLELKW